MDRKFNAKNVDKLKVLLIMVKKGHGVAINNLLIENGVAMTTLFYAEGAGQKYVATILNAEYTSKEMVLAVVNEKKYSKIRRQLEERFKISTASQGLLLTFDVSAMAGVLAYKYLSDYGGVSKYGKK